MSLKKSIIFFCLLTAISFSGFSQLKYGAKLNLGTSWISSGNLKDNFEFQMNNDPEITEWNVNYSPGILIGIGAVASYELTTNLSLQGELSFNYQQSGINIDFTEIGQTIESEATISSTRIAFPVSINYSLGPDKPVLLTGFEVNFVGAPNISSTENEYENNTLTDTKALEADLDVFENTRLNFLLGAGKSIDMGGNKLDLQLRYHLPLTSSIMYNTEDPVVFDNNTMDNNEVFGIFGAIDAAQDAPQYPLDDFKMHFLDLSIIYFF
ncbi:MAG: outer membrane beta-barrel protein [Candidatus Cyclobacteriaceae bacterium M2_1C_046]